MEIKKNRRALVTKNIISPILFKALLTFPFAGKKTTKQYGRKNKQSVTRLNHKTTRKSK